MWSIENSQGDEVAKCRWDVVPYMRGDCLDLGCGPVKCFPHFIGVDSRKDTELFGVPMKPDITRDVTDLSIFASGGLDLVFSSHLLEHIEPERVADTLKEWWRVIKKGGHLILYLPDEDEYPKVGEPGANPDHKWNVNYDRVIEFMPPGFDLVDFQKRNKDDEYSLWFVFKKL